MLPLDPGAVQAIARDLVPAALLIVITAIHAFYYRLHLKRDCQQCVIVEDLAAVPIGTLVQANSTTFDAQQRTGQTVCLDVPTYDLPASARPFARVAKTQRFAGGHVNQTVIFREDLELSGTSVFHRPLKVGGDLVILGDALFLAPVVVNGTLRVKGTAHFSAGVIAKDDALVRGTLNVGTDRSPGWAVLRDLLLARRLGLNGTIIAENAIQLKEAA